MEIPEQLAALLENDTVLRSVREKIRAGTAGFSDTARYTARAAEILGSLLGDSITDIPQGQREALFTALMRERYDDTFALLEAVQEALDAKQGIHIAPQKADYPEQRVRRAGRKADDPETSEETLRRIAGAVLPNIALSLHDDYMEKNAQFRTRLGLQCHITRTGGAKCCDWCADAEGRYLYQDRPADIFRRHDNCKCEIIYETQKGTTQLLRGKENADGTSARRWQIAAETDGFQPADFRGKEKPAGFVPTVFSAENRPQGFVPRVFSAGQAVRIQNYNLTNTPSGGTMNSNIYSNLISNGGFKFHANGTIVVTDDWKSLGKVTIPKIYKPFAIIESATNFRDGTIQIDRSIYDATGILVVQIHSGNHHKPKLHPYGIHGEHHHYYIWIDGEEHPNRSVDELTDQERLEHGDIL